MEKKLVDYFKNFLSQSNWDDENIPAQARSLFTSICLIARIDADTALCDRLLKMSYLWLPDRKPPYEDYENFMLEFIV